VICATTSGANLSAADKSSSEKKRARGRSILHKHRGRELLEMIQFTCGSRFQQQPHLSTAAISSNTKGQFRNSYYMEAHAPRWHDLQNAAESAYVCGGIHQQLQELLGNNFLHYFVLIGSAFWLLSLPPSLNVVLRTDEQET
jgi:hypothetical protein